MRVHHMTVRTMATLSLLAAACARGGSIMPGSETTNTMQVRFEADEAHAALAIAERARRGGAIEPDRWEQLFRSEGYRRLRRREAAMGRAFADSVFRAFLTSESLVQRAPALERTLAQWERADLTAAARRALAYLPPGTPLRATIYPMVKPWTNSFVFDTGTDSAAIFLYVDPTVSRAKLENTVAHELHHIGYAAACASASSPPLPDAARAARRWLGAFGEGVAMLAAAGGVDVHPHAASSIEERTRWDRDVADVGRDLRRIEAFLMDVLERRLTTPDSITRRAMTFFGDAQGPWYTVGYVMAATIERTFGRDALVATLCDPVGLLRLYDRAAAREAVGGRELPRWSPELLVRLSGQ